MKCRKSFVTLLTDDLACDIFMFPRLGDSFIYAILDLLTRIAHYSGNMVKLGGTWKTLNHFNLNPLYTHFRL